MTAECLVCKTPVEPFLDFGQMPSANAYLTADEFANEYSFNLAVGFCEECLMVQLIDTNSATNMFHQDYAFYSSTSKHMQQHFADFAKTIQRDYLTDKDSFVVEIGSNDGIMLKNFAIEGISHLGVEPSHNVAQVAIAQNMDVLVDFFYQATAEKIIAERGKADVICAANVIGHISDIHSVLSGVSCLLKPKGVFIFEHPYLIDNLTKTAYDQIYDEHIFYYSVHSVKNLFKVHGLELIDLSHQNVHGGSMRYVLAHEGELTATETVMQQLSFEVEVGIDQLKTYQQFAQNVARSKQELLNLVRELKSQGKRIVGYGATAKSSTVINYCGLTPDDIDYIVDNTPAKQNKYTPGAHIPIKAPEEFYADYPDYAILFAWNHANEIMAKEQEFVQNDGQWISFVPQVKICLENICLV